MKYIDISNLKVLFSTLTKDRFSFDPFLKYIEILIKWNKKINLVSTSDPERILEHIVDSLVLVAHTKGDETVLDVGSGAGFPGLCLKIACPSMRITLCESVKKKADFLKTVIRTLGLHGVDVLDERFTRQSKTSRSYDLIVSRGTMNLVNLVGLVKGHLKIGGRVIALKGPDVFDEISDLKAKGGSELKIEIVPYILPLLEKKRSIVIVDKLSFL